MRSDRRKALYPEPLAHPDPAVCELIEHARDQGRLEGWRMAHMAIEAETRNTERQAGDVYQ